MKSIALLVLASLASQPDPQQIIRRSVESNQASWKVAPNYSYTERDVERKRDSAETVKTYEILMVGGSPYNKLIAVSDQPLSSERQAEEARKLQQEIYSREHEPKREGDRRIAKYSKEREQDRAMLREMVDAFDYTLVGEQNLDGRGMWVLDARSKPGYQPKTRETKMLIGMKGKVWVDKATYQWMKVEAQVVKPVSLYGFIAKVRPGTSFVLEQEPVSGNLWLPKHFSIKVNATVLGFIHQNYGKDETYSNYQIQDRR